MGEEESVSLVFSLVPMMPVKRDSKELTGDGSEASSALSGQSGTLTSSLSKHTQRMHK